MLSADERDVLATLAMWDMAATLGGYDHGEGRVDPADRAAADSLRQQGLLEWTGEQDWARITPAGRRTLRPGRSGWIERTRQMTTKWLTLAGVM